MQVGLHVLPPLGQITISKSGATLVTVGLEIPKAADPSQWEVDLWLSIDQAGWASQRAERTNSNAQPFVFHELQDEALIVYFEIDLRYRKSVQFTVRFRPRPQESWAWAKDVCGLEDAFITVSAPTRLQLIDLPPLPGLDSGWTVKTLSSQSHGTRLWSLTATVPGAEGPQFGERQLALGRPWGGFMRCFGLVCQGAWLAPRHGKDDSSLLSRALLCSFLGKDGMHLVMLAVGGVNDVRSEICSACQRLQLLATSSSNNEQETTVLVAVGDNLDNTIAAVMYGARDMVVQLPCKPTSTLEMSQDGGKVGPAWMETWMDGLGYCTWNSLGEELTASTLLLALGDLESHGIHVSNLIIDDGWQSVKDQGWIRFEASEKTFPGGIKSTVACIRDKFPSIKHIAAWHSVVGYWRGIASHGDIAESYKTTLAETKGHGEPLLLVHQDCVDGLYDDFYKFLVDAGIDAVKVDNQIALDYLGAAPDRRTLISPYLDAWTLASLRHFSYRTISCMSQFQEALFHTQLPSNKPTLVARNSDDYFPEDPDHGARTDMHAWHLWSNAHNSLFTRYLNVLPDWDMFQTAHDYGGFHAAARCISGGPVCITDIPKHHDVGILRQISASTPNGRTVVLRPSSVARSAHHYLSFEDARTLKVGAYHGSAGTGCSILGVFNVTHRRVTELVSLSTFMSLDDSRSYIVRSHANGRVSSAITARKDEQQPDFRIALDDKGYDILTAVPLMGTTGQGGPVDVGVFGLIDKMSGCAAIVSHTVAKLENGRMLVATSLKALGVLGLWISTLPRLSIDDDFMITILGQPIPRKRVSKSSRNAQCLEIDIETAFKEMGLVSSWSNQVEVKVYFRA